MNITGKLANCTILLIYAYIYIFCYRTEDLGWKPAQQNALDSETSEELLSEIENEGTSSPSDISDNNQRGRDIIEHNLRQPIYVQHFEGKAGAILENEEAQKYGYTGYAQQSNIYAPFKSEVDWLFAKWSKLRGPGSTAVTELLGINQVSYFYYISLSNSNLFYRFLSS